MDVHTHFAKDYADHDDAQLRAFDNEIKPLSGKKANLQQMWAILTVLAMFLCRDVSFPWSMVDDGERYEHLIAVSGCAALTALNELDRVGQLKKDSRFLDLGHVMAMFLLWSKTATGMTVEGRIRHDPYDDDDAELEMYEWVGPLLAYAAKADIDLAEQRVSGIDKVLKRTTVGGLRGSAKADKWDWTATVSSFLFSTAKTNSRFFASSAITKSTHRPPGRAVPISTECQAP